MRQYEEGTWHLMTICYPGIIRQQGEGNHGWYWKDLLIYLTVTVIINYICPVLSCIVSYIKGNFPLTSQIINTLLTTIILSVYLQIYPICVKWPAHSNVSQRIPYIDLMYNFGSNLYTVSSSIKPCRNPQQILPVGIPNRFSPAF